MKDYLQEYFSLTDNQFNRLTTQQRQILDCIACFGSITPMDAFRIIGVTKLSTRVSEMRAMGIQFNQTYESGVNRYGKKVRYMRYRKAA